MRVTLLMAEALAQRVDMRDLARRMLARQVPRKEAVLLLRYVGIRKRFRPLAHMALLLGDILAPLSRLGLSGNTADMTDIRKFFLGVMRWPPESLYTASLDDLADAYEGFCTFHGLRSTGKPSVRFLKDMMQRFPDAKEGEDATL
ncbi:MAG: hypothetical protein OXT65_08725 [Alphaproteobacteria bacterium]|nr:hypothetical protein [Alphaproteobacteria bacterium]